MTVEVTTNKVQLPGDGSVFTFSSGTMEAFVDPDPSEIEVYVDDGSGNVTQYPEGTGANNFSITFTDPTATKSTFTITLPADSGTALLATDTVTIKNTPPKTQATDLSNQGPYLAEAQEETFDRLTLMVQDINENVGRTIRTNVTEQTFTDLELPNADSATAGATLILTSDKTGIEWGALAGTLPDPVTVARGGTGATTAAAARTNLGLAIGTNAQAWDAQLDDIAALAVTDGNIIVGDGTNWVAESGATARTSLGVAIGTNVQAWDAQLDDIAALAVTDGNFIVGDGTNWVAESGTTALASLGVTHVTSSTFTPTLTCATPGDLSVAYTTQTGFYYRIGNLVVATANIVTSSFTHTTASGAVQITTGLPVASENTAGLLQRFPVSWSGVTKTNYTHITGVTAPNSTTVTFRASGSGQAVTDLAITDLPTAGTVVIQYTVVYQV